LVRYTSRLLHSLVTANNGYAIGNVIGADIDTQTWTVKYLKLSLASDAARALNIDNPSGYSEACLPVSLIGSYEDGVLKINRAFSQMGCRNGIIECSV
jgi:hypothetical protein